MNEQVLQLFRQAGGTVSVSEDAILTYTDHFDPTKFAELIVQECADVCQGFGESGDGYTCSYEILEHFGVEE